MSVCGVSGNNISVVFQQKTRLESTLTKKTIVFSTTSLQDMDFSEIIADFHRLYMTKVKYYKNSEDITNEASINYHYKYCDDLIACLKKYPEPIYNDMALLLRMVQSFVLTHTISVSLIKMYNEYYQKPLYLQSTGYDQLMFFNCIKSGRLDDAESILRRHPNRSSFKDHLLATLDPGSRIFGLIYTSDSEFIQHFEAISKEAESLNKAWGNDKEFSRILKILSGDINAFLELNPTWIEYLIYHCLFIEGLIYDSENVLKIIKERIGERSEMDRLLLTVVGKNMHEVVQRASEAFPAFFIAHLVDILATAEQLPKEPSRRFEDLNYPEFYFWHYVNEIYTNPKIPLKIVCDYILNNLGVLCGIQDLLINAALLRLPYQDFDAMVEYLDFVGLHNMTSTLFTYKAMKFLGENDFSNGLYWAFKSKDKVLQHRAEKLFLDFAVECNRERLEDIIRRIDPVVRGESSTIAFLVIYQRYLSFVDDGEVAKAGEMLVRFFLDQLAPEDFYESIFEASLPLFERGLVLSYSNFLIVLEGYEKMCNRFIRQKEPKPLSIDRISGILAHCSSLSLGLKA